MRFAAFDQGQTPTIALVNQSRVPFAQWRSGATPAVFQTAMQRYADLFAGFWQTPCRLALSATPLAGAWVLVFVDDADQAGALGYHEVTADGLPIGHVFVKTTLAEGDPVSLTAAHELVEMLADPAVNLLAMSPKGTICALETADACEREKFVIDGVTVSDFCMPAYFESFRAPGTTRFDYLQHIDRPFRLLHGGYLPVWKPGQGWTQVFGSIDSAERCDCPECRHAKRRLEQRDQRGHRFGKRTMPAAARDGQWPALRRSILADHPYCAACGGTTDLEVHHIWPVSFPGGKALELDRDNCMVLCERPGFMCHLRVGHLDDYRARNPHAVTDAALLLDHRRHRQYPKAA